MCWILLIVFIVSSGSMIAYYEKRLDECRELSIHSIRVISDQARIQLGKVPLYPESRLYIHAREIELGLDPREVYPMEVPFEKQ